MKLTEIYPATSNFVQSRDHDSTESDDSDVEILKPGKENDILNGETSTCSLRRSNRI